MKNISPDVRRLTTLALLAAVAVVLVAILHFPLLPAAPFLEYDPADIPILIGTFLFGPAAGLALTVAASVLQGLTVSSSSGVIGIVMHIFATGSFVLVAGNVYKKRRTRKAGSAARSTGAAPGISVGSGKSSGAVSAVWTTAKNTAMNPRHWRRKPCKGASLRQSTP